MCRGHVPAGLAGSEQMSSGRRSQDRSPPPQDQIHLGLSPKGVHSCLKHMAEQQCLWAGKSDVWGTVNIPKLSLIFWEQGGLLVILECE